MDYFMYIDPNQLYDNPHRVCCLWMLVFVLFHVKTGCRRPLGHNKKKYHLILSQGVFKERCREGAENMDAEFLVTAIFSAAAWLPLSIAHVLYIWRNVDGHMILVPAIMISRSHHDDWCVGGKEIGASAGYVATFAAGLWTHLCHCPSLDLVWYTLICSTGGYLL